MTKRQMTNENMTSGDSITGADTVTLANTVYNIQVTVHALSLTTLDG